MIAFELLHARQIANSYPGSIQQPRTVVFDITMTFNPPDCDSLEKVYKFVFPFVWHDSYVIFLSIYSDQWPGHQRGLPRTVLTHDAVASAPAQLEGCVAEQRLHLKRGSAGETLAARQTLVGRPRHTTTVHQDEVPEDGRDWGLTVMKILKR